MFYLRAITRLFIVLVIGLCAAPAVRADVPILLYHHITAPEKFDKQMGWLAERGFHPVTMAQLSAHLKRGLPLPFKPIVITFDDGWKDQYNSALPVLKKYNFTATFFINSDQVGHSAYMNWDQVLEMSTSGMDIESHSCAHPRLPNLPPDQARREINDSKKSLESRLHKPVTVFSYPYGSYSDRVIAMVKDAGFETAVTVDGVNGGYLLRADRSYALPRYVVREKDDLGNIALLRNNNQAVCQALFVSLIQDPPIFSSKKEIDGMIDFACRSGINTLFVQVYRENKAWFPSRAADSSPYEKYRNELSEDPLALIIKQAHRQGIQVHAWLNMLSLSRNQDSQFIKKYGVRVLTRNLKEKKTLEDYLIDSQYFLEPGDDSVREDLSKIVGELLAAYPQLDGIQFDYIRYPDREPHYGYTQSNIERFKKATGLQVINEESPAWKEWKRGQVTELLALLVKTARGAHPGIQVSATGCMPYARAYYEAYQDWPSWVNSGIIDFVTIMDYSPDPRQFKRWLSIVKEKVPDLSRVKIGVGAYKLVRTPKIFDREVRCVEELGMTGAVFHYGSLLENPELKLIVTRKNTLNDR
jgi:uncharacterized lipoprotein YddW (UPF0748 family)/peptidoglycan/xylan/chitin deacetylase (PgdA/CDA1 family)